MMGGPSALVIGLFSCCNEPEHLHQPQSAQKHPQLQQQQQRQQQAAKTEAHSQLQAPHLPAMLMAWTPRIRAVHALRALLQHCCAEAARINPPPSGAATQQHSAPKTAGPPTHGGTLPPPYMPPLDTLQPSPLFSSSHSSRSNSGRLGADEQLEPQMSTTETLQGPCTPPNQPPPGSHLKGLQSRPIAAGHVRVAGEDVQLNQEGSATPPYVPAAASGSSLACQSAVLVSTAQSTEGGAAAASESEQQGDVVSEGMPGTALLPSPLPVPAPALLPSLAASATQLILCPCLKYLLPALLTQLRHPQEQLHVLSLCSGESIQALAGQQQQGRDQQWDSLVQQQQQRDGSDSSAGRGQLSRIPADAGVPELVPFANFLPLAGENGVSGGLKECVLEEEEGSAELLEGVSGLKEGRGTTEEEQQDIGLMIRLCEGAEGNGGGVDVGVGGGASLAAEDMQAKTPCHDPEAAGKGLLDAREPLPHLLALVEAAAAALSSGAGLSFHSRGPAQKGSGTGTDRAGADSKSCGTPSSLHNANGESRAAPEVSHAVSLLVSLLSTFVEREGQARAAVCIGGRLHEAHPVLAQHASRHQQLRLHHAAAFGWTHEHTLTQVCVEKSVKSSIPSVICVGLFASRILR